MTDIPFPKTRAEALGTDYAKQGGIWDTPAHWPERVHRISIGAMDRLGIDDRDRLYWNGAPIVTKEVISLEGPTFWVAIIATAATVVAALWPILVHFGAVGKAAGS